MEKRFFWRATFWSWEIDKKGGSYSERVRAFIVGKINDVIFS